MSEGWIALIAVGSVLAYAVGIGVTWELVPTRWKEPSADPEAVFSSVLWPLVLPVMAGAFLARRLRRSSTTLPKATVVK